MQQLQNAENGAEPDRRQPNDQIDIYNLAIESTIDSELIDDVLLGLGNYSSREYWQQVDAFRKGLFSVEAFSRRLRERAIEETKTKIAKEGVAVEWLDAGGDKRHRVDEPGWNDLDEDDPRWPEWAGERDRPIAFTNETRFVPPKEEYPAGAERGGPPKYRKAVVGLRRDQPDRVGRSYARQEAAEHLHEKADVLGVYETDINLNTDLEGALLESLKGAYQEDTDE